MHLQNVGNHASDYKTPHHRTLPLPKVWAKFNTDPTFSTGGRKLLVHLYVHLFELLVCLLMSVSMK
jgi:hypothetical protein